MRQRLLLDVDGVSADFVQATLDTLAELGGPVMSHDDIMTWNMLDCFPAEWRRPLLKSWMTEGWCRKIPLYKDALEGIQRIRQFADVVFVTTPMEGAPFWMWERDQWLREHFNARSHDIIFASAKHVVGGDMLVDDKVQNVVEWAEEHPTKLSVLWHSSTNQHENLPSNVVRAYSWDHVVSILGPPCPRA